MATCRRRTLDSYLSPCTNLISKCIKNLNIRPEALKSDRSRCMKHSWNNWHTVRLSDKYSQYYRNYKPTINKWAIINQKASIQQSATWLLWVTRQHIELEKKSLPSLCLPKGYYLEYTKSWGGKALTTKKTNNPLKSWDMNLGEPFKDDIQTSKRCIILRNSGFALCFSGAFIQRETFFL